MAAVCYAAAFTFSYLVISGADALELALVHPALFPEGARIPDEIIWSRITLGSD